MSNIVYLRGDPRRCSGKPQPYRLSDEDYHRIQQSIADPYGMIVEVPPADFVKFSDNAPEPTLLEKVIDWFGYHLSGIVAGFCVGLACVLVPSVLLAWWLS